MGTNSGYESQYRCHVFAFSGRPVHMPGNDVRDCVCESGSPTVEQLAGPGGGTLDSSHATVGHQGAQKTIRLDYSQAFFCRYWVPTPPD